MIETAQSIHENCGGVWNFLGQLNSLFGPDTQGNLWIPTFSQYGTTTLGYTDSILNIYRQPYFTMVQRVQGRWLYINNGYAISAVNNLVNMVMSSGFQYVCESSAEQDRLDEWLKHNNYAQRSREAFTRLLIDGEMFFRLFEDGETIRFVDPGIVYDPTFNGIKTDPFDYEAVEEFILTYNGSVKTVPGNEIQHRKLGFSDEKRGISILFAIAPALIQAAGLLDSLTQTARSLSKFAAIRTSEASATSVAAMRSDIQAQQNAQFPNLPNYKCNTRETVEAYAPGSILDVPAGVSIDFPGQGLDGQKYVDVLRAVLRLAAARVGLPENVLSQDNDSIAAYTGQLAADSHIAKGLKVWQERLSEWDLQLFEMAGFNKAKIHVEYPSVAITNKGEDVQLATFLLDRKLAAKSTVGAMFGLDEEEEQIQMKNEDAMESDPQPTSDTQEVSSAEQN